VSIEEMKVLARQGIKMTHRYFSDNEWLIMRGNIIVFEDNVTIFLNDWISDKDWVNDGWSKFEGEYHA